MAGSTLTLAWRNLWRSRRRTILALTAIGLSQALVLVYDGMVRGYGDWMRDVITGPMLGHAQVHAEGWRKDRAIDRTFPVDAPLAALRALPGVARAHARIYAPALGAVGEEGFVVMVVGVEPAQELGGHGLLSGAKGVVPAGKRVLVGRALADAMELRPGATLAVVGQGADGSLANDLYEIAAVVSTPVDLVNRMGILMALDEAQALLAMPGEAHEIVLRAEDPERAEALAAAAGALPALRGLEVLDWKRLAPELVGMLDLVAAAWKFVLILVFIAAAAGVANTMLMATFERTHELGMLLALGVGPGRLVRILVVEALALGLVGVLAGTALGGALIALGHRTGVDFAALTGGGPSQISFAGLVFSLTFYPSLTATDLVASVLGVAAVSLLAALWPAVRVARLQPTAALRE
jgi:ABC-type lipoprotein release transport system permease subunit